MPPTVMMEEQCANIGCTVRNSRVVGDAVEMISGGWKTLAEGAMSLRGSYRLCPTTPSAYGHWLSDGEDRPSSLGRIERLFREGIWKDERLYTSMFPGLE